MQPTTQTKTGERTNGQLTASNDPRRHVRNQTPQESLGLASGQAGLWKASVQAGIIFAVGFAVLTIIPFALDSAKGTKPAANATRVAPADGKADDTSPITAPQPTPKPEGAPKGSATPTGPKIPGKDDLLNKLGETGTKTGTPKSKDPFKANGDDDLFK